MEVMKIWRVLFASKTEEDLRREVEKREEAVRLELSNLLKIREERQRRG